MKSLETFEDLTDYTSHLAWAVEHHGTNLKGLVETVLFHVIRLADQPITVRTWRGRVANALWAVIGGERYVFSALRKGLRDYEILVKQGTARGPVVATFTDTMTRDEIVAMVSGLKAA